MLSLSICNDSLVVIDRGMEDSLNINEVVSDIDKNRIMNYTSFLVGRGSRFTGYPGFYETADFIYSKLTEYLGSTNVWKEEYTVTVPVDLGASVNVLHPYSLNIKAYPLKPNGVNLSPANCTGKLYYVGDGTMVNFDGIDDVKESIILMDFNSRWHWKNAMLLGAKAVIFIATNNTSYLDTQEKTSPVPFNFPRLCVSFEDGMKLKALAESNHGEVIVHVESNMIWERKSVPVIVGRLPGTDKSITSKLAIVTYYDSDSVVPSIAPGATDALGVSALLELARLLKIHQPASSIQFIFFPAHWQSIEGARQFFEAHFHELSTYSYIIGLDFSTDSKDLGVFNSGSLYAWSTPVKNTYSWIVQSFFGKYLPEIESQLGEKFDNFIDGIFLSHPVNARIFEPHPVLMDTDAFSVACYGGGLTLRTTNALRVFQGTIADTLDKINYENLWPQIKIAYSVLYCLANEHSIPRTNTPVRFSADVGYATLTIQPSIYNATINFQEPFYHEDLVVATYIFSQAGDLASALQSVKSTGPLLTKAVGPLGGVTSPSVMMPGAITVIAKPDENGVVKIYGLKPYSTAFVVAYVIDPKTGVIKYATDLGVYGAPPVPVGIGLEDKRTVNVREPSPFKYVGLFRCGVMEIYNIINPELLSPEGMVIPLGFIGHGSLIRFGIDIFLPDGAIVYAPTGIPIEIVIQRAGLKQPFGLLINSSSTNPTGSGYILKPGETLKIYNTPIKILRDFRLLLEDRVNMLMKYGAFDPRVSEYRDVAEQYYQTAENFFHMKQYSAAYGYVLLAWSNMVKFYGASMDLILGAITTSVTFTILIVPFSIIIGKMITPSGSSGVKKIAAIVGVLLVGVTSLYILHPGFHIASSVTMVIISVGVAILTLMPIPFVSQRMVRLGTEIRGRLLGMHFIDTQRISLVTTALSIGIEHMKKRPFRSILVLLSLTIINFSMVCFTSMSNITITNPYVTTMTVPYSGILIRKMPWSPIPENVYYDIVNTYRDRALITARAWIYPPQEELYFTSKRLSLVKGLLGVSPTEANVTNLDSIIIKGRWFKKKETYVCLVSSKLASTLSQELGKEITLGDEIQIYGVSLKIIGIFNGSQFSNILELDGELLTPVDLKGSLGAVGKKVPHLDGDSVIIVPINLAVKVFEAPIVSIAMMFRDVKLIQKEAYKLSIALILPVFASSSERGSVGKVILLEPRKWVSFQGLTTTLPPLIIAAFTILNIMLASVYERMREMSIYSAVGLSPTHVSILFLAEAAVYAILSSVIGYILGILGIRIVYATGGVGSGFYPNYASYFVFVVVGISIAITFLSTLYPSLAASRLVVPSLRRKWVFTTKPKGDEWIIPLPITVNKDEALSLLSFLAEFLDAHKTERTGLFQVSGLKWVLKEEAECLPQTLTCKIRLAPYDANIRQKSEIYFKIEENRYMLHLRLERLSGSPELWINSNYHFVDTLRKQFLIWRSLDFEDKKKYVERFRIT